MSTNSNDRALDVIVRLEKNVTGGVAAAGPRCEINVTPLIDVLLVLLIVFMIITPLMPRGLPAEVAQSGVARVNMDETPVVLRIMGDHTLRWNGREMDLGAVKSVISQVFAQRANKALFIEADAQIEYREVAQLMDVVRGVNSAIEVGLAPNKS